MSPLLATDQTRGDPMQVVLWSALLLAALALLYVVVMAVRRRLGRRDEMPTVGFTLADLRQLHKKGHLSNEEYEKAKGALLAAMRGAMKRQEERKRNDAQGAGS
jgi:hypothetical protein